MVSGTRPPHKKITFAPAIRDQAIEPEPTRYVCAGGGKTYMKLGGGGGKAYMKLKSNERVEFDTFCKGGLCYIKLSGGVGEHYLKSENDVPYHVCSVSIAWSLNRTI